MKEFLFRKLFPNEAAELQMLREEHPKVNELKDRYLSVLIAITARKCYCQKQVRFYPGKCPSCEMKWILSLKS